MLNVSKALMYEGEEFPFEADVELEDTLLLGDPVAFPGTAHLAGQVKAIGDSVQVRGEMEFTASARCALCLKEASRAMKTTFDAVFALAPNPDNPDLYLYEGKELDLTDMATDAATLALPSGLQRPLPCMRGGPKFDIVFMPPGFRQGKPVRGIATVDDRG